MSLLQINKKAVTQKEISELRNQVSKMDEVLGVKTCVLHFDDHFQHDYKDMLESIENRLSNFAHDNKASLSENDRTAILGRDVSCALSNNFSQCQKSASLGFATQVFHPSFNLKAHNFYPDIYIPPSANIIQVTKSTITGADFTESSIGIRLPFASNKIEDMRLQVLLHEIGHGVGACEPQTEAMAAVMFSQTVEDNSFLTECADMRILNTVLRFDQNISNTRPHIDTFGLPMCEVNDFIRALPREEIDEIDTHRLLNMRFNIFDHQRNAVISAGNILKTKAPEAFEKRDLRTLKETADDILQRGVLSHATTKIMTRFMLASVRMGQENSENQSIDQALLQSEKQAPITFDADQLLGGQCRSPLKTAHINSYKSELEI